MLNYWLKRTTPDGPSAPWRAPKEFGHHDGPSTLYEHISHLCIKAVRQLNSLQRIAKYLSQNTKKIVFNSFILSNFDYFSYVVTILSCVYAYALIHGCKCLTHLCIMKILSSPSSSYHNLHSHLDLMCIYLIQYLSHSVGQWANVVCCFNPTVNKAYLILSDLFDGPVIIQYIIVYFIQIYQQRIDNHTFNTLRPRQNGRLSADDTFKRIFLNGNNRISIKIALKFVPKGLFNNIPVLVLIMVWRRPGDKPLSEPMMVRSLKHICVTRPQWVNPIVT